VIVVPLHVSKFYRVVKKLTAYVTAADRPLEVDNRSKPAKDHSDLLEKGAGGWPVFFLTMPIRSQKVHLANAGCSSALPAIRDIRHDVERGKRVQRSLL
jgi:hypothetical protein